MATSIRCHYDVLNVARDADEKGIKKAHRKLALKYHPDKNYGDEEAAKEFLLLQEAYECLSDPSERKYYDEPRESILRGVKPGDDGDFKVDFIFDVTPFHFWRCHSGYGDGEGGFFAVYGGVFDKIMEGEYKGWIGEGNIDENEMPNSHLLPLDFGDGSSDSKDVSKFYNAWESFSSCLSFAWADKYDPREAESRFVRRRIDEENKRARKAAKNARNEDIVTLVAFVKKRDPRVKAARELAEREKAAKEQAQREEVLRLKAEAAVAREAWLEESQEAMRDAAQEDLDAGRIRLADLDDSEDDYYGSRKGKKGKKKGRKQCWSSDEEEEEEVADENAEDEDEVDATPWPIRQIYGRDEPTENSNEDDNGEEAQLDTSQTEGAVHNDTLDALNDLDELSIADEDDVSDDSYEEDEDVEKIWKCEFCKKTFKSEAQFDNHLNSKKHKETFKKFQKKNKS